MRGPFKKEIEELLKSFNKELLALESDPQKIEEDKVKLP